jgi:hypothetical protein
MKKCRSLSCEKLLLLRQNLCFWRLFFLIFFFMFHLTVNIFLCVVVIWWVQKNENVKFFYVCKKIFQLKTQWKVDCDRERLQQIFVLLYFVSVLMRKIPVNFKHKKCFWKPLQSLKKNSFCDLLLKVVSCKKEKGKMKTILL